MKFSNNAKASSHGYLDSVSL